MLSGLLLLCSETNVTFTFACILYFYTQFFVLFFNLDGFSVLVNLTRDGLNTGKHWLSVKEKKETHTQVFGHFPTECI